MSCHKKKSSKIVDEAMTVFEGQTHKNHVIVNTSEKPGCRTGHADLKIVLISSSKLWFKEQCSELEIWIAYTDFKSWIQVLVRISKLVLLNRFHNSELNFFGFQTSNFGFWIWASCLDFGSLTLIISWYPSERNSSTNTWQFDHNKWSNNLFLFGWNWQPIFKR